MTIYKYEKSVHNCGTSHDRWLCTVCDIVGVVDDVLKMDGKVRSIRSGV